MNTQAASETNAGVNERVTWSAPVVIELSLVGTEGKMYNSPGELGSFYAPS